MNKKHFVLAIVFVLLLPVSLYAQTRGLEIEEILGSNVTIGKQWAVFIAIDRYQEWTPLSNPVRDAKELRDILLENYIINEVRELYDREATAANIRRLLVGLRSEVGVNDSVFVFYAGHGYTDGNTNTGFWIPSDGGRDVMIQANWLPNNQVRNMITQLPAKHVFLISDSCFSGDILDVNRGAPPQIDNNYYRQAYARPSRQVMTSGASETVSDLSEFAMRLKSGLRRAEGACIDPEYLFTTAGVRYVQATQPLLGVIRGSEHQEGGSFLFFRKQNASAGTERPIPNGFVRINGGTFTMGSPRTEARRDRDEVQHQVTVSSFYMSSKEVTLMEYMEVMQFNPNGLFQGANLPVINVNWYSAVEYCNARSIAEGLTPAYQIYYRNDPNNRNELDIDRFMVTWDKNANGYRLPTEAEWEYACRAGTSTAYSTGNGITNSQAHFNLGEGVAYPVGSFPPNRWGLYDMHGNVSEWCWDWYGEYTTGAQTDPSGPASGRWRVAKGGNWRSRKAEHLRSAYRLALTPTWYGGMGIRLVRSITSAQQPQQISSVTNVNYSLTNAQRKASRTRWQVGAFSEEGRAYYLRSILQNAGIDTSTFAVERIVIDRRGFYCATVGENLNGTMQILLYQAGFRYVFRRQ